jgi:hypothetical protein
MLGSFALAGFVEWLAGTGRAVTLIAPTGTPGWQVNIYSSFAWRARLKGLGVRILPMQQVLRWDGVGTTTLLDLPTGERRETQEFDAIVAPAHAAPRDALVAALTMRGWGDRLRVIGDAAAPRSALEAVFEGHEAGRAI